ncbi:flagellar basal body-associated protein FliL [Celerinatantimonas sp. MCCC 1A17872]|uniref:flagellar basal body-associated protein FliL n=1 Tax=Celerinatantimonas sp. MCCC 1A17872 TaxID=3177514 RepID=UPI0038C45685
MKWFKWVFLFGLLATTSMQASFAADDPKAPDTYAYYSLEPDIVTNYITAGKSLGYIRATIELRVYHESKLKEVEHNSPLLRDAIIEILGSMDSDQIKSLSGRDKLKEQCLNAVNNLLFQETGDKNIVADLIFTKYLYQ